MLSSVLKRVPAPLACLGAWLCVALLGVLSWLPASQMGTRPAESVGLPGYIEHLFAYFCTAAVLTLAYPGSPRRRLMGGLIAYATLLEVGQLYVPGRAAQPPFIHGALLWVVWTVATRVTDAQARQADRRRWRTTICMHKGL
jgi:VanZ family protein